MESFDREEMIREFGEPGVENPNVVDLIQPKEADRSVTLVMIERRPWTGLLEQLRQIEEKINRYLGYVLDGYLVEQYPGYDGWPVTIRLECREGPHGDAAAFLASAQEGIEAEGLGFEVRVRTEEETDEERSRQMAKATWNGHVIAESANPEVVEGNLYFPPDSVHREFLRESDHHTTCPWKGEASYFHLEAEGERNENAAWYYPAPKDAAANIRDHVAFWRDVKVEG